MRMVIMYFDVCLYKYICTYTKYFAKVRIRNIVIMLHKFIPLLIDLFLILLGHLSRCTSLIPNPKNTYSCE